MSTFSPALHNTEQILDFNHSEIAYFDQGMHFKLNHL